MPTLYAMVASGLVGAVILAGIFGASQLARSVPREFVAGDPKTAAGFCRITAIPARYPCSCVHPLHGQSLGRAYSEVELIDHPEVMPAAELDPEDLGP